MGNNSLIIDGNSIGWASHYATKLKAGELETQAVFGFLNTMRSLRSAFPGYSPLCLWDGKAKWRFEMEPAYKSNRDNDPAKKRLRDAYVAQRPYIARGLEALGIPQMVNYDMEADDLAGYFVARSSKLPQKGRIQLVTGDKDWIQLVRSNVSWLDLRDRSRSVNIHNFEAMTGYSNPIAFLQGKALQGDNSDVISGIDEIAEKRAQLVLREFGSVPNYWKAVEEGKFIPKRVWEKNLAEPEARLIFSRNIKLMQLQRVPTPDKASTKITRGKLDIDKLAELCEELAFMGMLRNIEAFVAPFEE